MMISFYNIFLICFLCVTNSVNVSSNDHKIVGGLEAYQGQFPYQVALKFEGNFRCGGTIVNHRHVVTAGHCVVDEKNKVLSAKKLEILVGTILISYQTDGVKHSIEKVHLPKSYSTQPMMANDIAVLRIKGKFNFNAYVKEAPLPQTGYKVSDSCLISGWGTTREGGNAQAKLRYAIVPILNINDCKKSIGIQSMSPDMLCAGYYNGGIDSCQGDSGGPLVCNDTLTGVVSHGYGCAQPRYPGIYTDVHYHSKWIADILKSSSTMIAPLTSLMFTIILFYLCI